MLTDARGERRAYEWTEYDIGVHRTGTLSAFLIIGFATTSLCSPAFESSCGKPRARALNVASMYPLEVGLATSCLGDTYRRHHCAPLRAQIARRGGVLLGLWDLNAALDGRPKRRSCLRDAQEQIGIKLGPWGLCASAEGYSFQGQRTESPSLSA